MITWKDIVKKQPATVPTKLICDICGADATGKTAFGGEIISSQFIVCLKNTHDRQVSETAMINQTVPVRRAELCEPCALAVEEFINDRAASHGRRGTYPYLANEEKYLGGASAESS